MMLLLSFYNLEINLTEVFQMVLRTNPMWTLSCVCYRLSRHHYHNQLKLALVFLFIGLYNAKKA